VARIWVQLFPLSRRPLSGVPGPPARPRPGAPKKFAPAPSAGAAECGTAGSFAAGRTCAGAKLGSQRGPGPACSAHGESRAHLSVAPRELQKTVFLHWRQSPVRPIGTRAPAREPAGPRVPAASRSVISYSAARDLAGLRARCAAVRSRALSLSALSPPAAGALPHRAGQPWACPQATALQL
jgi:hypothetical protein